MIKPILLSALLLIPAGDVFAQLYFRNNTKTPVLVAYAKKQDPKAVGSWFSQGWFPVKPKEKVVLNKTVGDFELFYYYVQTADGAKTYDGTMPLWVDPINRFIIQNPDMMDSWKGHPEYQKRPFRILRLQQGAVPKEYTIDFKG